MDAGFLIPCFNGMEEVVGNSPKSRPIKISLRRKVVLITVFATKIAEVSNMPLEMEWISHRTLPPDRIGNETILKSFEIESQTVLSLTQPP
jgi:hypothetical protein